MEIKNIKFNPRLDVIFYGLVVLQSCVYIIFTQNRESTFFTLFTTGMLLVGILSIFRNVVFKKRILNFYSILMFFLLIYELFVSFICNTITAEYILYIASWKICFLMPITLISNDDFIQTKWFTTLLATAMLIVSVYRVALSTDYHTNIIGIASLYAILVFLPFMLRMQSIPIFKFIYIIMAIGVLLLSQKRAGFLCIVFVCVLYLIYKYIINEKNNLKKTYRSFGVCLLVCLFCYVFFHADFPIFERINALASDGGNGRAWIWEKAIQEIHRSDIFDFLFGHGMHSVNVFLGRYAHNDFIAEFYDFGLIGFSLYVFFIMSLFYHVIIMKKNALNTIPAFISAILIMLILCNTSVVLARSDISNLLMFYLGYEIHATENHIICFGRR